MNKKGVAEIIVLSLLIILILIVIILIFYFLKNYKTEEIETKITCLQDVDLEIVDSCYKENTLQIKLRNNKETQLGRFLKVIIYYETYSETIPTPPIISLAGLETQTISLEYNGEKIEKIKIIPRLEREAVFCSQNAPEFNPHEC